MAIELAPRTPLSIVQANLARNYSRVEALESSVQLAMPTDIDCVCCIYGATMWASTPDAAIILNNPDDTRRAVHAFELIGFTVINKTAVTEGSIMITLSRSREDSYGSYNELVGIGNAHLQGCSLESYEEEIPARTEIRYRVVCDDGATEL